MLFRQGESRNFEYNQSFKEKLEVLEAYNRGTLFGNSPGAASREIKLLELDANRKDDFRKAQPL